MKIAKSFVASILSFALIFTLYVKPTAAAYNSVQPSFSTQQEESYSFLLYRDMSMPLMSDISSKQIAEKYSTQLATITGNSQRICGQITWETLEQIKAYIKCHNSLDNSFYSLLSDIAIAATEQKLALGNPTYVDHARYNQTLAFATQSAFERNAQNSPDYFIN